MINYHIVHNYAAVMKELATKKKLYNAETLHNLKKFYETFGETNTLLKYLSYYGNKKEQIEVMREILAHYHLSFFDAIFETATDFNHGFLLIDIIHEYIKNANKLGASINLEIVSAYELSLVEEKKICDAIQRLVQKEVHATVKVDPKLIGGLKVQGEGFTFDNSVAAKLNKILKGAR
ncbi:MAG: F0F1 ATP synthase subunit delta [Mycoplasmataceae bacterium]|jgi:ATP synthase F1 delta subunit|nr:F0F1 ATP synthase subunit delta [Mycoplasmataceae bacterium]